MMERDQSKSDQNVEISFRPVTEGLGFHPFSDGLPYAPMAKSPKVAPKLSPRLSGGDSTQSKLGERGGAGATAAGLPRYAVPSSIQQNPHPVAPAGVVPSIQLPINSVKKELKSEVPEGSQDHPFHQYGYAYLGRRVLAYCFDAMFNFLICILALGSLVWRQEISPEIFVDSSVLFVACLAMGLLHWVLVTVQEVVFKTTLGKRIFGLIFDAHGLVLLLRAILFIPSMGFMGLGILWSLFDRQKSCWHDRATRVQPIEIARF